MITFVVLLLILLGIVRIWAKRQAKPTLKEATHQLQRGQNATCCDLKQIKKSGAEHLTFQDGGAE